MTLSASYFYSYLDWSNSSLDWFHLLLLVRLERVSEKQLIRQIKNLMNMLISLHYMRASAIQLLENSFFPIVFNKIEETHILVVSTYFGLARWSNTGENFLLLFAIVLLLCAVISNSILFSNIEIFHRTVLEHIHAIFQHLPQ